MVVAAALTRPKFEDLPLHKEDPPYSAWGLYGKEDRLGALNLITPERIIAAAGSEIKQGIRVGLNLPLNQLPDPPAFGRQPFVHKIVHKAPRNVHDDIVELNTQVRRIDC